MKINLLGLALAAASLSGLSGAPIIGNSVTGPYQDSGTSLGTKFVGFTVGAQAVTLDSIDVALGAVGLAGGTVTFTLNADNGSSLPGGLIGTIGFQSIAGGLATAAYNLAPALPFVLASGTTYWVGTDLAGGGQARWDRTNPASAPTNGLGTYVSYAFNGTADFAVFNAIIINGTADSTIPEPSAMWLIGAGVGVLALVRRRTIG